MKKCFLVIISLAFFFVSCEEQSNTLRELSKNKNSSSPIRDNTSARDLPPEDPNGGGQGGPPNTPVPYPSALPWILSGKPNASFNPSGIFTINDWVIFARVTPDMNISYPDPSATKVTMAVYQMAPGNIRYAIQGYCLGIKDGVSTFPPNMPVRILTMNAQVGTPEGSHPMGESFGTMTVSSCSINASGKLNLVCSVSFDNKVLNITKTNLSRTNQ